MLAIDQRSAVPLVPTPSDTTIEKTYGCRMCGDQFKREDHLRRHELSHQKPKFTCQTCGKPFHRNDVLKRHQLVHRPGLQNRKRKLRTTDSKDQNVNSNSESSGRSKTATSRTTIVTSNGSCFSDATQFDISGVVDYFAGNSLSSPIWSPTAGLEASYTIPLSPISASVNACVEMTREHTLVRTPFLHSTTLNYATAPSELLLALASLGARDIRTHSECGLSFFIQAERTCRTVNTEISLRKLQVQVLLIEYAATTGNVNYRNWAVKEQHVAAQTAKQLLALPPPQTESVWQNWLHVEELKRTVYALYVLSATLAALYGLTSPLICSTLELSFPCEDELWNARDEAEWSQALLSWSPEHRETISFPKAVHTILSGDQTKIAKYAGVGNYGHLILLCGLLEAIDISRKAVFNYRDVDDFVEKRVSSFIPRAAFVHALNAWKILWAPSLYEAWITHGWAHPHLETYSLMTFMIVDMVDWTQDLQSEEALGAVAEAVQTLVYFGQVGVDQVVASAPRTLTIVCYTLAKRFAQIMHAWVTKMEDRWTTGNTTPAAMGLILMLQQASRQCVLSLPREERTKLPIENTSDSAASLTGLADQISTVWTYILRNDQWIRDNKILS